MEQEENINRLNQSAELSNSASLEDFNYEKIFSDTKFALIKNIQEYYPQLNTLSESDPLIKTLHIAAYRELLVRQKIKDVIKSSLVSRAKTKNLALLAQLILEKEAIQNQSDKALRNSIEDFWKKKPYFTTGTATAYKYFTQQIAGKSIRDVSVIKKGPATINIYLLLEKKHGLSQDDQNDLLKKTKDYLNQAKIRRITDKIQVEFATTESYDLIANLKLFPNYNFEAIKPTIYAQLIKLTDSRFYLNKTLATKYFFKAFYQQGIKSVSLDIILNNKTNQSASLAANPTHAYSWTNKLQFTLKDNNE